MKYILDENIKHILNERFILTEAITKEDLANILQNIKERITNINNTDDTDKKELLGRLIDRTNNLSSEIAHVNDASIIKGHVDKYFSAIDSMLKALGAADINLKDNFVELKNLAASADTSKKITAGIKSKLNEIINVLNKILNTSGALINKTKNNKGKDETTTYTENDQKVILTNLYRNLLKLYKGGTEKDFNEPIIDSTIKELSNLINQNNTIELLATAKKLNDSKSDFAIYITNTFKDIEHETENELNKNLTKAINWGLAYKKAPDKDSFWEDYYKNVWGENADKIKALGAPFRQECERLGFTKDANPFLAFIEQYYALPVASNRRNLIGKREYPITPAHYTAIHDAVARGELGLKELISPVSPISENNMIIWCRDFYVKSGQDAKEYLKYFTEFKRKSYDTIAQMDNSATYQNLLKHLGDNMESILYNIFVETLSVDDLLKQPKKASSPQPIYYLKLRSLADVKRIAGILNVTIKADSKSWDPANNAKLVTMIKNNDKFKDNPAMWAKWFIITIARHGGANPDKLAELSSTFSWWENEWKKIPYKVEVNTILKELVNLGGSISSQDLDRIIKAFNKEDWLK